MPLSNLRKRLESCGHPQKAFVYSICYPVFRIGSVIPVPFLNIVDEINEEGQHHFKLTSLMTGSAFTYGTILMSITPYINASIIMQLLAVAIPALERLQKEGEEAERRSARSRVSLRLVWAVAVPGILLLPACQRLSDEGCQRRSIHRL